MIFSSHSDETSKEFSVLLSLKFHSITVSVDMVEVNGVPFELKDA